MGQIRFLGCALCVVGNLARKLLVAFRTCPYIRSPHNQQGQVAVLEKGIQGGRKKKRTFRALWIQRINAAARQYGMTYSQLIGRLAKQNIELNRKVLADLAMNNPQAFEAIINSVK